MRRTLALTPVLLIASLSWATPTLAQTESAEPIDFNALSQDIITTHITPGYDAFAASASTLETTVGTWCSGTAPAKQPVLAAFNNAVSAWQAIEHIRFGVASELSAHSRVNYWPDRGDRVNKHLRRLMASPDLDVVAKEPFLGRSIAVQGFPAMERLLYDAPYAEAIQAAIDAPSDPASKPGADACLVLHAIATNVAAVAEILSTSWQDATAGKDLAVAAFGGLSTGLEAIADTKLNGPSGAESGKARPKLAENWRSERALQNVAINLEALSALYQHLADAAPKPFINSLRDIRIRDQFVVAIEMDRELGPSLGRALSTELGRDKVLKLALLIKDLRDEVITHFSEALSIRLGFNSLDGD